MPLPASVMIPPKSIWDPQEDDSDDIEVFEDEEVSPHSTRVSSSGKISSKSNRSSMHRSTRSTASSRKHPSDLDEVELRVQLWDSYRLARIILGIPIKSFSLKSKTILKAIRIVAEMKLDLIRLNKELEMMHIQQNGVAGASGLKSGAGRRKSGRTSPPPPMELIEQLDEERSSFEEFEKESVQGYATIKSQLNEIMTRLSSDGANSNDDNDDDGELQQMLRGLIEKVEASNEKSQNKLQSLQSQTTLAKIQDQMQTRDTLHKVEIESSKAKHLQQVMDMSGQLESYKEQVERQQETLMEVTKKYEDLEAVAVTSADARQVLLELESSTPENQKEVQQRVVEFLKKMAILHNRQEHERAQLQARLRGAQKKERESEEELRHLRLQQEMLEEETNEGQEYQSQMSLERKQYKKQITQILKREERRLMEMEYLEVRLTELAFTAVELEDLNKEAGIKEQVLKKTIKDGEGKAKASGEAVATMVGQVCRLMEQQHQNIKTLSKKVDSKKLLKPRKTISTMEDMQKHLQEELDKKDEALAKAQEELARYKQRVEELERPTAMKQVASAASENTDSTSPMSL